MKYFILLAALIVLSACELEKSFRVSFLAPEEVVLKNQNFYIGNSIFCNGDTLLLCTDSTEDDSLRFAFHKSIDGGLSWEKVVELPISFTGYHHDPWQRFFLDSKNRLYYESALFSFIIDIDAYKKDGLENSISRYNAFGGVFAEKNDGTLFLGGYRPSHDTLLRKISINSDELLKLTPEKNTKKRIGIAYIDSVLVSVSLLNVCYSTDEGKSWIEVNKFGKYYMQPSDSTLYFTYLQKLNNGELLLYIRNLPYATKRYSGRYDVIQSAYVLSKGGIQLSYALSKDGINWNLYPTSDTSFYSIIDKPNDNVILAKTGDKKHPIILKCKNYSKKFYFPESSYYYTPSGYIYYERKKNICRRKIILY